MDFDGVTFMNSKVVSREESEALDAALGLVSISLRFESNTYKLLNQLAEFNGISLPHMLRTIIEQRLKI